MVKDKRSSDSQTRRGNAYKFAAELWPLHLRMMQEVWRRAPNLHFFGVIGRDYLPTNPVWNKIQTPELREITQKLKAVDKDAPHVDLYDTLDEEETCINNRIYPLYARLLEVQEQKRQLIAQQQSAPPPVEQPHYMPPQVEYQQSMPPQVEYQQSMVVAQQPIEDRAPLPLLEFMPPVEAPTPAKRQCITPAGMPSVFSDVEMPDFFNLPTDDRTPAADAVLTLPPDRTSRSLEFEQLFGLNEGQLRHSFSLD